MFFDFCSPRLPHDVRVDQNQQIVQLFKKVDFFHPSWRFINALMIIQKRKVIIFRVSTLKSPKILELPKRNIILGDVEILAIWGGNGFLEVISPPFWRGLGGVISVFLPPILEGCGGIISDIYPPFGKNFYIPQILGGRWTEGG